MQDPATFQSMQPHFSGEQEHLQCPRCDSTNTKFCYYNNYNLSQPRHFCKNCRRYWTKGGALRNIPVGGGTRKNKQRPNPSRRSSSSPAPSSAPTPSGAKLEQPSSPLMLPPPPVIDQDYRMLDISGSFSALLNSNGQFGSLLESMNSAGPSGHDPQFRDFPEHPIPDLMLNQGSDLQSSSNREPSFSEPQGEWSSSNGWPDLAIYTPGSNFQ